MPGYKLEQSRGAACGVDGKEVYLQRQRGAKNAGNVRIGEAEQHSAGGMLAMGMIPPESFIDKIIRHDEESWQTASPQTHGALQKGKKSHVLLGFP